MPTSWRTTAAAPARRRHRAGRRQPDAGRPSTSTGTASPSEHPRCTVRLSDPLVSRVHTRVLLSGGPVVSDEGSALGTRVRPRGGAAAGGRVRQHLNLGDSAFVVNPPDGGTPRRRRRRRPAPAAFRRASKLELDTPTPPSRRAAPPAWAMLAIVVVLGGALFLSGRSSYALVFVVG